MTWLLWLCLRSAYLLYYFDVHPIIQQEIPNLPQSEINKRISESWKRLNVAEKAYYLEKAKSEKEGTDTVSYKIFNSIMNISNVFVQLEWNKKWTVNSSTLFISEYFNKCFIFFSPQWDPSKIFRASARFFPERATSSCLKAVLQNTSLKALTWRTTWSHLNLQLDLTCLRSPSAKRPSWHI